MMDIKTTFSVRKSRKLVCLITIAFIAVCIFLYGFKDYTTFNANPRPYLDSKVSLDNSLGNVYPLKRDNATITTVSIDDPNAEKDSLIDVINSSFLIMNSEGSITRQADAIHQEARTFLKQQPSLCVPRLPQCLIVGNFTCGTMALLDSMSMHPRIRIKNLPYYEFPFFDHQNYFKGLEWFRKQMPCSYDDQITIVKKPSYFQSLEAPIRIHAMNSSIRLIVLVREPVSRAVAHFTFLYRNNPKFNIKEEVLDNRTGEINKHSPFVWHSIYDEGMDRYLRFFNQSQIKIIEAEEFKRHPFAVLKDLEEFLNVEHTIRLDNFVFNTEKGYHCLRQNKYSLIASCYGESRGRNITNMKNDLKDQPDIFDKLKAFFKPHNERFYKLVGRVFDW